MYNEKDKMAFLESIKADYSVAYIASYLNLFRKFGLYEKMFSKDIAYFSMEELLKMFKELDMSATTMSASVSQLRKYFHYVHGNSDMLAQLRENILNEQYAREKEKVSVTYVMIQQWLDKLINPLDQFILLGLYSGIKGDNYCELASSSMDGSDSANRTIWLAKEELSGNLILKHRQVQVSEQLFNYALQASEACFYIQEDSNGIRKKCTLRNNGAYIYKTPINTKEGGKSGAFASRITQKFRTIYKQANIPSSIKLRDIYMSGLAYQLKKAAVEQGLEIRKDYDYLNLSTLSEIENQYDIVIDKRALKEKIGRYL